MTALLLKKVTYSLLIFLTPAALFAAAPVESPSKPQTVEMNVGIYAPFSNKRAFIGRNILAAMEMAQVKFAPPDVHYSFFTLDTIPLDQNPQSILQQFTEAHQINVLVTEGSVNGNLLRDFAKKNHLLHFSMASDPGIADGKNNFLIWSPASEQAKVLVHTLKQKKIKELGIITTNSPSDQVLTSSVVKQIEADSSIKISHYAQYDKGTKDFSDLINKLKKNTADLYFIMASPEDIELIQKRMKEAHINKPVTSIVERVTPKVMKVFDGLWYVDTHEMNPEFVKLYQEEYRNYPVTEAGYAYDLFHMLNESVVMAMKTHSHFSTEELADQIHLLAMGTGVMGPFNVDEKGILFTKSEVKRVDKTRIHTG